MKMEKKLLCMSCIGLLSLSSVHATTTKTVNIDDVYKYRSVKTQPADTNYQIQAGVFSASVYADQYKKYLDGKTQQPVRVVQSKNRYYVFVGPFSNASTMVQVGQQLKQTPQPHRMAVYHRVSAHSANPAPQVAVIHPVAKLHVIAVEPVTTPKRTTQRTYMVSRGSVNTNAKPIHTGVWKDMDQPLYRTGPYVGASVGPQSNISGLPTVYSALEGTVSAGWGHMWTRRFYLAGEIFGADSKKLKSYPANPTGYTIQSNWSAGADIIPGYMITDTFLGYLRLGWVKTDFNIATDVTGQASFAATSYTSSYYSRHMNVNGWQVGVGGQTNILKNLDLRAEYIFSLYNSVILIGKPQVSQFNVGLVYKFDPV
ncbi:MAG: outer membrane beta-barrel protein [Legionellaceae bacterium]|nr:outer membrane beta-barrel protein [Legionellaceae bacterium]